MTSENKKKAGPESVFPDEICRLVVESVPQGIIVTDKMGRILYLNAFAERMFGYGPGELPGKRIEILMPGRFRSIHKRHRSGFVANPDARPMGKGRDLYAIRSDGSEFPVEVGLNFLDSPDGVLVISTVVDITERIRSEKLLHERDERLREVMDNTTDAIFVFDTDGMIETLNLKARELFFGGPGQGELSIWQTVTPENRKHYEEKILKVKNGKSLSDYETERMDREGKRLPVSASLVYMGHGGGKFIETVRDISERLKMRIKLIEIEKAQVIGKMAEGFAHHMGTPLASMLLRVQMLKEDVVNIPGCEEAVGKLSSVEKQILYGQKVIRRLLKFVGRPDNEKSVQDLSGMLEESIEIIRPLMNKKAIVLNTDIDDTISVFADSNLMSLVFTDTMMNALEAMPEGGVLTVVSARDNSTGTAHIRIIDTGTGISEDIVPFIFEPFFTTKHAAQGTGLGLSVAKRIVLNHEGGISVESSSGKGTTVSIVLPVYTDEEASE